ncbi:glutathione peroxidase [Bacterioplanoides sp. SCSIO 12839]|uniref:glutathione peroxidase n=1 Tax=Bacterioplanoides sp. SCSIO 12839 TaxID=2829569 RepID=UPI002105F98F|nr:redoxin domain-containing protein [Bacterioplanoides sp. SCSIO 12839]UTW47013.1 glutathione peroxidase [Bacterioplanoides sp. SCSIO 12839]
MKRFLRINTLVVAGLISQLSFAQGESGQCPDIFQHKMKQLHSSKILDLCEVSAGKPVLLVNTASHCGFTDQFGDLEAIHQKYKDQGLVVIGVSSDSFDQEDKDEGKAAEICFKNFGVSFTMLSTVPVRGDQAHPLFQEVARQDVAPKWNFYKYLIDRDGNIVDSNSSFTLPDDDDIEALLAAES